MTRISEKKGISPMAAIKQEARELRERLTLTEKERDDLKAKVEEEAARIQRQVQQAYEIGKREAEALMQRIEDRTTRGRWRDTVKKYPVRTGIVLAALALVAGWFFLG